MFGFLRRNNRREEGASRKLFYHTDIHSHVCPGIDDGSGSVEESVALVKGMKDLGITRMIITPHIADEVFPNDPASIAGALAELKEALARENVDMEVSAAAEHRMDENFNTIVTKGEVCLMPHNYILVENPWIQEPFGLPSVLRRLEYKYGYKPILAHPERYPYYLADPEVYQSLFEEGVRFQVNLLSLAGYYGKKVKHTAETLLREHKVSFLGSDVHNIGHVQCIADYVNSKDYDLLQEHSSDILNDEVFGG
jgi:tyrosine-protein phosphatase YwqE